MSKENNGGIEEDIKKLREANRKLKKAKEKIKKRNGRLKKLARSAEKLARTYRKERFLKEKIVKQVDFDDVPTEYIPPELLTLKRFREK